jgi:type II secretory pathway predicted ATPase ExeA
MTIEPFSATPYPSALYLTPAIKETLRIFRSAIESRQGLMILVGDVGYGKSSLLHLLYGDYMANPNVDTVFIGTPTFSSPFALVKAICEQLGIPALRSLYAQQQALEELLSKKAAEDRNVVVLIDEAQLLDRTKLESLRWMLNIETHHTKMIQFVLAGQLELWTRISSKWNRALRSRVYSTRTMQTMTPAECQKMLEYRCEYAGVEMPFEQAAVERIFELSGGVPRSILQLAHEAWKRRAELPRPITPGMVEGIAQALRQKPEAVGSHA